MTSAAAPEITVTRAGPERLDDLEPLWKALHDHHAVAASQLAGVTPFRSPGESWTRRRASYAAWLEGPDAFALIAEHDGEPVGYAFVRVGGGETMLVTGDRVGSLETLSVLPHARGRGIGTAIVDEVYRELGRLGVRELTVDLMATNTDAARFYERRGMIPYVATYLGRVDGGE